MLHKETLLLNVGKKDSPYKIVVGGDSWIMQGWISEDGLAGSELTPTTLPNGQEFFALFSMSNSPQTTVSYYGNKIDSITVTRLDTNKSVTCPYYSQADANHQNTKSGVSLFSAADLGKEILLNITIP